MWRKNDHKMEWKKLLLNARILILLFFLIASVFAINPRFGNEGASIRSIEVNGSASLAGMDSPKPSVSPISRERIVSIDNKPITDVAGYYAYLEQVEPGDPVQIKTNKGLYKLIAKGILEADLGITVSEAPKTNIRKGLDLQGGTRIMLEPEKDITEDDMELILLNMNERLNAFGLSDVTVRAVADLEGARFILVEIAGANEQEIRDLIAKQGKFEAKIGNATVFRGGKDVTYVCRSADCSGLSPSQAPVQISTDQWSSVFQFSISLSGDAARKMADATRDLEVIEDYLSEPITLFLDDQLVDELQIGSSLKGQVVNDISISGPGAGSTRDESQRVALDNMKRLQTILITGSLPVKLEVVKTDSISPVLGSKFVKDALIMAVLAILAVAVIIFIRYRKLSITLPIIFTALSEVVIILGFASLIKWNIDIASIAGILVAVGTGVDDQIVILDESLSKRNEGISWVRKLKNAFFIIFAAYFTGLVSMVPLLFAGAGLLKGFALTSIAGITIGVLITRPAFAKIAEHLFKED